MTLTVSATATAAKAPAISWRLCTVIGASCLISTLNGYGSSLMGSVNAMTQYHKTFGLSGTGSSTGIIFIVYNFGQISALPFFSVFADGLGRRWCMLIGCLLVLAGTAVQATSNAQGQFIAGRLLLGSGASISSMAASTYIVELAHPAHRGFQAGIYNSFWWIGNILAGWVTFGANTNIHNSWAWRVPVLLQGSMPAMAILLLWFLPESPRWLIAHDRRDEAIRVFADYHTEGDIYAPTIQLQLDGINEQMQLYKNENAWWDFRELVSTRGARYRLACVAMMSVIGQWSGNNVVTHFMPQIFKTAGITKTNTQLLLTAISPILSMLSAICGASYLDKIGRRLMLLISLTGSLLMYCLLTAFTAESRRIASLSVGVIVSVYFYGIFFAFGCTPLQTLYVAEILQNRTRAKGSAVSFLIVNVAMIVNIYGVSVGIGVLTWKIYLIYVGWLVIEILAIYFFFVETSGKTLEELDIVFNAKQPVRKSKETFQAVAKG